MKKDDMDNRIGLPKEYRISHGGRNYIISRYISAGGNSIVYEARYQDSLMPEKTHQVLIKELYPYDPTDYPAGGYVSGDRRWSGKTLQRP